MGPLHGLRILEFAGIGPMAAMLLSDIGADQGLESTSRLAGARRLIATASKATEGLAAYHARSP